MADLGTLGGSNSEGRAINNAGQVTGWSYRKGDNFHHAFLYSDGAMIDLGISALESDGNGINAAGDIVGSECDRDIGCRAFLYSKGKVIDLNAVLDPVSGAGWRVAFGRDINDAGWIVADGCNDSQSRCGAVLLKPRSAHCRSNREEDRGDRGPDRRCDPE